MIPTLISALTLTVACIYDLKYRMVPHKLWIPALLIGLFFIWEKYAIHPILIATTAAFCIVYWILGLKNQIGGADAFALIILSIINPEPFTQALIFTFTGMFLIVLVIWSYIIIRFKGIEKPDVSTLPALFAVACGWVCAIIPQTFI